MPQTYPREIIDDLVNERLDWDQLRDMMSSFKDADRFQQYQEIRQEQADWDDPIVLPYAEHLSIVAKASEETTNTPTGDRWVIQCDCGHEFCDYDENWKLHALINVRDTEEEFNELYPDPMYANPDWQELREYFCPGCKTQLEVEAMMPWYPPVHAFEPDIEAFYNEWINQPIPTAEG